MRCLGFAEPRTKYVLRLLTPWLRCNQPPDGICEETWTLALRLKGICSANWATQIYSDFIASRQRFRRFTQMKRKWWFREGGSNIQLQSQSLLFYLILNYPEIYIYIFIFCSSLLNIVYHKPKSFSTQFLWFTFNMYKAKSCLVYAVI